MDLQNVLIERTGGGTFSKVTAKWKTQMIGSNRFSALSLLMAPIFISALFTSSALSADRSDGHAFALSYRYGAYTKKGNLAAGETVLIDTPEGPISCTGGDNRTFTGKFGPEGSRSHQSGVRRCHFN